MLGLWDFNETEFELHVKYPILLELLDSDHVKTRSRRDSDATKTRLDKDNGIYVKGSEQKFSWMLGYYKKSGR